MPGTRTICSTRKSISSRTRAVLQRPGTINRFNGTGDHTGLMIEAAVDGLGIAYVLAVVPLS
jgi:hypothetical protein